MTPTPDPLAMRQMLDYWQRQLRIQDWEVTLRVCRHHEMGADLGRCAVNTCTRKATVSLLEPADYAPDLDDEDRDLEMTLVHELLHIAFPGDEEDGSASVAMEQAIDATALALVRLKRGKPR